MVSNVPKVTDILEKIKNDLKVIDGQTALDTQQFWSRSLIIGDICPELGEAVENIIRFWNNYDDINEIPVKDREPIKLYIDSVGGDLCATLTMIDAIRLSKTPVWGINIGTAYSGGFFTYIACHKRFAYKHSSFLYHEGSAQNGGTSGQFQNFASFYKKQLNSLKDLVLETTNITDEEYEKIRRDDVWYSAEESLEKGITDEIPKEFI